MSKHKPKSFHPKPSVIAFSTTPPHAPAGVPLMAALYLIGLVLLNLMALAWLAH